MPYTIPAYRADGSYAQSASAHSPRTPQGDGKKKKGGNGGGSPTSSTLPAPPSPHQPTFGGLPPINTAAACTVTSSPTATSRSKFAALEAELGRLQRAQSTLRAALAAGAGVAISPRAGGVPAGLADILAAAEPSAAKARAHAARQFDAAIAAADAAGGLPPCGQPPAGEAATLLAATAPPKFGAVSAGLTGFNVAGDLLSIDFSVIQPPSPEAFVAPRWDAPRQAPAPSGPAAAASVAADPVAMAAWVARLETQQRVIVALLEASLAGK
jgi:hypothetical protein